LVADILVDEAYPGDHDTVLLLVSEVVTNAVRHAATPFELIVQVDDGSVTVRVVDHDRAHPPRLRHPTPEETSGRGLLIVERYATSWGYEPTDGDAKSVWFSMR
jgi:anti-sigma regulatory factor (Ser/Thr protein kinase)